MTWQATSPQQAVPKRRSPGGPHPPCACEQGLRGACDPLGAVGGKAGGGGDGAGGADFTPESSLVAAHHVSAEWDKVGVAIFIYLFI